MGFTQKQIEQLQEALTADRVKEREGSGGKKFSYIEGYDAIDTANRIFGFDGWGYEVIDMKDVGDGLIAATIRTHVFPPLAEGEDFRSATSRSDVGIGTYTNANSKEKAYKEAVTDGLKRALRAYGNQFGNSLYDKASELRDGGKAKSFSKTGSSTPKTGGKADIDVIAPNDGDKYKCETCGEEIVGTSMVGSAQRATLNARKNGGKIICNACSAKAAA